MSGLLLSPPSGPVRTSRLPRDRVGLDVERTGDEDLVVVTSVCGVE